MNAMSSISPATLAPEPLWFMGSRVTVLLPRAASTAGVSMLEHLLPGGFGVPLHLHDEDETFYVLEGRFRFRLGDAVLEAGPGDTVHAAARSVHAFKVLTPVGRLLTVTSGRFEEMVRGLSVPAAGPGLPPFAPPTEADVERLIEHCAAHGIDFVGPPLD